jgi:hypothetical protein
MLAILINPLLLRSIVPPRFEKDLSLPAFLVVFVRRRTSKTMTQEGVCF